MSRCQACDKQATHHSKHGALAARCCSERCGRELFAGLSAAGDGTIHVAAASPLGRAIAQRTRHSCDHILPASVAAQLVGALQRIGPKRAAADADLPASEQADAPTSINWVTDIPRDVWATAILPYLQRDDLRAFAATSSSSAAAARDERVQAAKYRENRTPYHAALTYVAKSLTEEKRRVIRFAYPNVAELALARLLVFDVEQIYQLDRSPADYRRLIKSLRTEAGRDGDELYARPIQVPIPPRTIILDRRRIKSAQTVPAMAGALVVYTLEKQVQFRQNDTLLAFIHSYVYAFAPPISDERISAVLETSSTPCLFSYPYLFGCPSLHPLSFVDDRDVYVARGVDFTRTDAGFWLAEMLARHDDMHAVLTNFASIATPEVAFGGPRTDGQLSLLYMAKKIWKAQFEPDSSHIFHGLLFSALRDRNLMGDELRAPIIMNGPDGNTILHILHQTNTSAGSLAEKLMHETVRHSDTADGIANPPLLVRNARGEIPMETIFAAVAAMKPDVLKWAIEFRVRDILASLAMKGHPFARSTRNKPIMAILPVEYHRDLLSVIDQFSTTNEWDNDEVKRYVAYMAAQIYTGTEPIDKVAPILHYIFIIFYDMGRTAAVVEPVRPLLAGRLGGNTLQEWFD